jgi:ribonucleoside-diphosphate reductase beta chain
MEHTHAMSYSSGVDQAFGAKATEFLDIIYTDPKIKDRIQSELDVALRFVDAVHNGWEETLENKKLLLELLTKIFALEGIKFPFSFFTTWTLNRAYNNCAQGFSQLLIKISIDEMQVHTVVGASLIKKLRKSPLFAELFQTTWYEDMANEVFSQVASKEKAWAEYLLEDGEVPGFNQEICNHFIEYWTDRRRNEIGLEKQFNVTKNDIEKWFDSYRSVNDKHSALQEVDNISYQIGQVRNDLSKFDKEQL